MGNWAVNPSAFEPRPIDVDGISLFREDFVTQEYLASVNKHPAGARVARITAKELAKLGLSLQPSPDPNGPPGHTVISEMRFTKRTAQNKAQIQKMRDIAQELAQISSKNEIYAPEGLPDPVAVAKDTTLCRDPED